MSDHLSISSALIISSISWILLLQLSLQANVFCKKLFHLTLLFPNLRTGADFGITSYLTGLCRLVDLGLLTSSNTRLMRGCASPPLHLPEQHSMHRRHVPGWCCAQLAASSSHLKGNLPIFPHSRWGLCKHLHCGVGYELLLVQSSQNYSPATQASSRPLTHLAHRRHVRGD